LIGASTDGCACPTGRKLPRGHSTSYRLLVGLPEDAEELNRKKPPQQETCPLFLGPYVYCNLTLLVQYFCGYYSTVPNQGVLLGQAGRPSRKQGTHNHIKRPIVDGLGRPNLGQIVPFQPSQHSPVSPVQPVAESGM